MIKFEDMNLARVDEFHRAYKMPSPPEPYLPELSEADRDVLGELATELVLLAQRLKKQAAQANADGRAALGLALVRMQLHVEEPGELAAGLADQDEVQVFDALLDIDYVTNGTFLIYGMGEIKALGAREVHRSNMSKLGNGGKPLVAPSGRVLKGPNYSPPELAPIIMARHFDVQQCVAEA
jgi:predicted HAD superfamily Cof-like phosphohydrolase